MSCSPIQYHKIWDYWEIDEIEQLVCTYDEFKFRRFWYIRGWGDAYYYYLKKENAIADYEHMQYNGIACDYPQYTIVLSGQMAWELTGRCLDKDYINRPYKSAWIVDE